MTDHDGAAPDGPGAESQHGRTRYANGVRRRLELADAILEVFAQEGFQQLSVRQIAAAAGTSHTMLLHHFGSKDAILEAVLTRREELEGPWRRDLIDQHGLLDGLPLILAHHLEVRGLIRLDAMLIAEADHPEHPAHDYVIALLGRFYAAVRAGLEDERAAGRLRDGLDLDLTARQITALVHGLQSEWLQDPGIDMAAAARAYTDLLRA